jgi:hypothetical protein
MHDIEDVCTQNYEWINAWNSRQQKIKDFTDEWNKQYYGTFELAQERVHKLIVEEAAREKPRRMLRPIYENC